MKAGMWVLALLMMAAPAIAQDDKAEIEKLKKRVDELEKKQSVSPAQAAATEVATVNKSTVKFHGFIRLDVIYDDSRAEIPGGATQMGLIGYVRSEDPAAPAAIRARSDDNDAMTIHPRLSRFGMDFNGGTVGMLWEAKLTGKIEIDFYNGGSESRDTPRMRHAYLKLMWDNVSFLAGQTSDLISPLFPIINLDMVMWGAGNLGDRRPQIRTDVWAGVGDGTLTWSIEAGLTGAVDGQVINATDGKLNGQIAGLPTLQTRLGYKTPFIWEKQNLEIGVWAHYAWEDVDARINGQNRFESWAAGVDLSIPLYESCLWLKMEAWMGANLSDVRGGIFQDINANGQEIRSRGGFIELGIKPMAWLQFFIGYSTDDPARRDLTPVGVGGGNSTGRNSNRIYYFATHMTFDAFKIGVEYHHWTTEYIGGLDDGTDNRVVLFFMYTF